MTLPRQETILLPTEADTIRFGARLAAGLGAGDVVSLIGTLGAGKTRLAQAICVGLGVTEPVTSPTYAILHEYDSGRVPVRHMDLYRIADEDELAETGALECFSASAVCLVEWGDRFADCLPARRIEAFLGVADDGSGRTLTLARRG